MPSRSKVTLPAAYPPSLAVYAVCKATQAVALRVLIDTGATYTMIPRKVARATGLDLAKAYRRVPIITASAVEYVPVLRVPMWRCVGVEVRDLDVICHDLPPESAVDGLLGINFLQHCAPFQRFQREIRSFLIHP